MWQTLAAVVVVVAGIVGVITYFATKSELNELRCEAMMNLQLVDENTKRLEAEQAIFNAKVTRDHLKRKGAPHTEMIKVEQVISTKEKELDVAIQSQNNLAKQLRSNACRM